MFDVIVVGAGPTGSRTAELLAKSGLKVLILEKKRAVGKTACSGLISRRIWNMVPLKSELILHSVYGARFHSGTASVLMKKSRRVAFVIDRPKFDNWMLRRAKDAGATVRFSEPFLNYAVEPDAIVVNGRYRAKVLVGADGAASHVRRASGLRGNLTLMNGAITHFTEKNTEPFVDVFYDNRFSPDFFAWKIPRGESVEYGVASKKNHLERLRRFLESEHRKLTAFSSHPMICGITDTAAERLVLVGDAAAQVKPFSGGGVIYGLLCAKIAACAIHFACKKNDFSKAFFEKNYDSKWKQKLLPGIQTGALLLSRLKSLSEGEKAMLFKLAGAEEEEVTLFADMDFL